MKRLALILLATIFLGGGLTASAALPADPRVTAAVAAWKTELLYVDPLYAEYVGTQDQQMRRADRDRTRRRCSSRSCRPATWFQEKDDTERLAGWLAVTNGKPGMYVVMDGTATTGVAHLVARPRALRHLRGPRRQSWPTNSRSTWNDLKLSDREEAKPARTGRTADRRRTHLRAGAVHRGQGDRQRHRRNDDRPDGRRTPGRHRARSGGTRRLVDVEVSSESPESPDPGGRVAAAADVGPGSRRSSRGGCESDPGGTSARDRDRADEGPAVRRPDVRAGAAGERCARMCGRRPRRWDTRSTRSSCRSPRATASRARSATSSPW